MVVYTCKKLIYTCKKLIYTCKKLIYACKKLNYFFTVCIQRINSIQQSCNQIMSHQATSSHSKKVTATGGISATTVETGTLGLTGVQVGVAGLPWETTEEAKETVAEAEEEDNIELKEIFVPLCIKEI